MEAIPNAGPWRRGGCFSVVVPSKLHHVRKGFLGLLLTQFFGAMNDNLLKMMLTFAVASGGLWASHVGEGGQAYVALCLSLPFILLSGLAGQVADRFSKQRITFTVKGAEIGIAAVGLTAFWIGNLWIALGAMLLLSIQSSFFAPAKYGMIPELVPGKDLSRANGTLNLFTNVAVIVGTVLAGPVYTAFYPADPADPSVLTGTPTPWIPGLALLSIAILGWLTCLLVPALPARNPNSSINLNPFSIYLRSLREMAGSPLLAVALGWAFFYLLGILSLLVLPDYRELLQVSETRTAWLAAVLGVAIGGGCLLAGLLSGPHIRPRFTIVGALGMSAFFLLLGSAPLSYGLVAVLLVGAGIFAGFYLVPLQALLQSLSPPANRGRFLGTANAISFVAITLGNILFLAVKQGLHLPSHRVFLINAALAILGTAWLSCVLLRKLPPAATSPTPR